MINNFKSKNLFYILFIVFITALIMHPEIKEYLSLNRDKILLGEYWRIVTGNIVHTNIYHWVMNILALTFIFYIFKPSIKEFEIVGFLLCLLVGIEIYFFTDINNYKGLSGVLHGLFAYYVLKELIDDNKDIFMFIALFGLTVKVTLELNGDSNQYLENLINARIAIESHFYGAINGVILIFVKQIIEKIKKNIESTKN